MSIKTVSAKKTVFGNGDYSRIITLKPASAEALFQEARQAVGYDPSAVEWRIDYFNPMVDGDFSTRIIVQALEELSKILDDIPLILTFRKKCEAYDPNLRFHSDKMRRRTIGACVKTGLVDVVDVEIGMDKAFMADVFSWARENGTSVMLSYHKYDKAPETQEEIYDKLLEGEKLGADIVRCAYMAWFNQDVIRIGRAAREAKKVLTIPMCCYAMGDVGSISRILGDRYGSDMCFFSLNGSDGGVDERIGEYKKMREALGAKY